MSLAVVAVILAPHFAKVESDLWLLDAECRVLAYLNDVYVVIDAEHSEAALHAVWRMMASMGMDLQVPKTRLWTLDLGAQVPASMG